MFNTNFILAYCPTVILLFKKNQQSDNGCFSYKLPDASCFSFSLDTDSGHLGRSPVIVDRQLTSSFAAVLITMFNRDRNLLTSSGLNFVVCEYDGITESDETQSADGKLYHSVRDDGPQWLH